MGLTIIVPIKVPHLGYLTGFADCYRALLRSPDLRDQLQLIVVDDSEPAIFAEVDRWFTGSDVLHFAPRPEFKVGRNNKLNSVYEAMAYVRHESVLILDDDYRPSAAAIQAFTDVLRHHACAKSMVVYLEPTLSDLINSCGIFVINLVHAHHQFCGHIGFRMADLREVGFPEREGAFDELVFELRFRQAGKAIGWAPRVFLEMVTHGPAKFVEQRVRYAYENLAYPFRFVLFLIVLPALFLAALWTPVAALGLAAAITAIVWALTLAGQLVYARGRYPALTWVLGPVWFWTYPIATWIAVACYFAGGIRFGGQRLRRAV